MDVFGWVVVGGWFCVVGVIVFVVECVGVCCVIVVGYFGMDYVG